MDKMVYEECQIEVIVFEECDIITDSDFDSDRL